METDNMKSVNNGASFSEIIDNQIDKHNFEYESEDDNEDDTELTDIE